MSYCAWCGRKLGQDEVFCKNCGTQASPSSSASPTSQSQLTPAATANKAEKCNTIAPHEPATYVGGQPFAFCVDWPNIDEKGVVGKAESCGAESQVKMPKYGLLGFRSRRVWKMVIASLWYAFWLLLYLILMTGPSFSCSQADLMTYRLSQTLLLLPFVLVPILLSSFRVYEKLPGKKEGRLLRILAAVLCTFILFAGSSSVSDGFSQEYQDSKTAYELLKQAEFGAKDAEQAARRVATEDGL